MKKTSCIVLWGGVIVIVLAGIALLILPAQVEKSRNKLYAGAPYQPTQRLLEFHKKLFIVDMHEMDQAG